MGCRAPSRVRIPPFPPRSSPERSTETLFEAKSPERSGLFVFLRPGTRPVRLGPDLLAMLVERGRRERLRAGRAVERPRMGEAAVAADDRMVQVRQHALGLDLREVEHVLDGPC